MKIGIGLWMMMFNVIIGMDFLKDLKTITQISYVITFLKKNL